MMVVGVGPASAGPAEPLALTAYASAVAADAAYNTGQALNAVGDNITCDPTPVVEGTALNPRIGYAVGEVYGQDQVAATWKCVSLDTGTAFSVWGVVIDKYFSGSGYSDGVRSSDGMTSIAGAATVKPLGLGSYAGGSPALNTWHYARFEGWTSTGRSVRGDSALFYLPGV